MDRKMVLLITVVVVALLAAVWITGKHSKGDKDMAEYTSITMDEAKKIFETERGDYDSIVSDPFSGSLYGSEILSDPQPVDPYRLSVGTHLSDHLV